MKKLPGSKFIPFISLVFFVALALGVVSGSTIDIEFKFRLLVLIPVFSIATNILLLWTTSRHRSNIKSILWFGIFIVTTIFWALADVITFLAENRETGMFARSFVLIPALIGVSSVIIFFSDITSEDEDTAILPRALMLLNALFYLVIGLGTDLIFLRKPEAMIQRSWGWEMQLGPYGNYYLVWTQITLLFALWIVARNYLRAQSDKKRQARIFLIGVMIPVLGSTAVNIVPAILGIPIIPMDSLFTTLMAVFMTYGINKYKLFTISPTQISKNILQTMEEAVVVVDLRFTIQYANKNAVRMLKLSEPVSSSGQHLKDFFEPEYFELLKDTARGGYSHSAELSDIEVLPKNSKKSIPVEISASRIVSDNKKSNADGYIFVISDVSALQQAYAKLAEQEKRVERKVIERTEELYAEHAKLEVSIAGLPIGLIMLDDNLEIIESNRVAKDLFEFRGNSRWYVAETLKDLNLSDKFTEMVVSRKTTEVAEMMIGGKTIHVIFAPITTAKDDLIGSVIIVEDISSRKAAEIERNEFIVTASHEIRTPLTVIQGNLANVIDDQDKIDKKLLPLVKNAHQASNRISNLFNDVLIIADIESEARPKQLYLSKFSLKDLMLEVVAKYKPSADAKKLQLSLSGVGDKWKIKGDRDEISEAIGKLVDNAIKFTKSGFVKISLSKEKGSVVVRIADSGRGISKEEEPRLFKKFVRLDNSLKRDVGGTGLGLYIAKSLAERNGGELILEKSSKTGSTFKLSLPLR